MEQYVAAGRLGRKEWSRGIRVRRGGGYRRNLYAACARARDRRGREPPGAEAPAKHETEPDFSGVGRPNGDPRGTRGRETPGEAGQPATERGPSRATRSRASSAPWRSRVRAAPSPSSRVEGAPRNRCAGPRRGSRRRSQTAKRTAASRKVASRKRVVRSAASPKVASRKLASRKPLTRKAALRRAAAPVPAAFATQRAGATRASTCCSSSSARAPASKGCDPGLERRQCHAPDLAGQVEPVRDRAAPVGAWTACGSRSWGARLAGQPRLVGGHRGPEMGVIKRDASGARCVPYLDEAVRRLDSLREELFAAALQSACTARMTCGCTDTRSAT